MKSEVIVMSQPAVDKAVDEYMHRNDPAYFHKRFQGALCPMCPTLMEELRAGLAESLDVETLRENIAQMMEDE